MSNKSKNTLSNIVVERAMRRQVNRLIQDTTINNSINTLIKYKVNGLLTIDGTGQPVGVLSKTDIMGAYYAEFSINSSIELIMASPPLFCYTNDLLEQALEKMRDNNVYRLYVKEPANDIVVGALAYPDIVGMLYKYCHECAYSYFKKNTKSLDEPVKRLTVNNAMSRDIKSVIETDTLQHVIEEMSMFKMGAILVNSNQGVPVGVISKTDLILAYKHGLSPLSRAETIMSNPVQTCNKDDLMEDAIRTMIFKDIHRLFVKNLKTGDLVGVFSLSDAARSRSGSCKACISSRITP